MSLRIVFMGTPEFAVPTLSEIIGQGHEVVACYTRAPAPGGRGMATRQSPVHALAEGFGIPVFTPKSLRDPEVQETLASHEADVFVVVAYGMILPQAVLDLPPLGCLNLHASDLPRWRGAAPIQRAVMAGDAQTGVAVMKMEAGLDTGPVGMVEHVPIDPEMSAGELHDRLMILGADLMVRALAALSRDALDFKPQPEEGVSYAAKITNGDAEITWTMPARRIHDQVRGLSPFPGAFFMADCGKGFERVKLLRTRVESETGSQAAPGTLLDDDGLVACAEGSVRLLQVQRSGKSAMSATDMLRGARLEPGALLVQP
ncbi:MAG: methionyl-tRNA formyltransferase [Salinarimonas sp.]